MAREIFPTKHAGEACDVVFDFADRLPVGITLSSAAVTSEVFSGTDADSASIVSGADTISGSQVTQKIINGVAGVIYDLVCTAVTSDSKTLVRRGYLAVIA